MILCARATRGLRKPSLGLMARLGVPLGGLVKKSARSGRPISPHHCRENEPAWTDYLYLVQPPQMNQYRCQSFENFRVTYIAEHPRPSSSGRIGDLVQEIDADPLACFFG